MKTLFRNLIFLFLLCIMSRFANAQITEVNIGVNGLTCSQCSRSVELRLRKLDFVKDVQMNLEHTEGKITFKDNKKVEIDKIAQSVVDAGFSVRQLTAKINMNNVAVSDKTCWNFQGDNYEFVKTNNATLKGMVTVQFLGDKYQPRKDYKKWSPLMKNNCPGSTGKTYFVSI